MTGTRKRTDRTIEEMRERRSRSDATIDGARRLKLRIPPEVEERLKTEGRTARWVIKDSARMHELLSADGYYSRVTGVAEIPTRNLADGSPIKMVLLSTPTEFLDEDRAKLETARKAKEAAMTDTSQLAPGQYLDEASKITRGGQTPP